MAQTFANGTKVRHKSGTGPTMVVVEYGQYRVEGNGYKCRWFDDKNQPVVHVFTEAELEAVAERERVDVPPPPRSAWG